MNAHLDVPKDAQTELSARTDSSFRSFGEHEPFIEKLRVSGIATADPSRPAEFTGEAIVDAYLPLQYIDLRWVHGYNLADTKNYEPTKAQLGQFGFVSLERVPVLSEQPYRRGQKIVTFKATGGPAVVLPSLMDSRYQFYNSGVRRLVSVTIVDRGFQQNTLKDSKGINNLRPVVRGGHSWKLPQPADQPDDSESSQFRQQCLKLFL